MLIIGERINSTRKTVAPAVKERNTAFIEDEARKQGEAGAHYIDCNGATVGREEEPEALCWLVQTVQACVNLPISLDSPNPDAIEAALKVHRGAPIINSITGEREKLERLLPLVRQYGAKVIALCMDDEGMPKTGEDRIRIGLRLIDRLLSAGVPEEDVILDPLLLPISVDSQHGISVLQAIAEFKRRCPNLKVSIGLTNVSYGLPERRWLNRATLILAMGAGLDAVICDPTDRDLMAMLLAAEALLGKDEFCARYLAAARAGLLSGA
ncbi:MAG: dihydropteroate synthase [Armatimonadetes bacterium]|nr:dihydropteroate synthase [Armatimonadota bacterium]